MPDTSISYDEAVEVMMAKFTPLRRLIDMAVLPSDQQEERGKQIAVVAKPLLEQNEKLDAEIKDGKTAKGSKASYDRRVFELNGYELVLGVHVSAAMESRNANKNASGRDLRVNPCPVARAWNPGSLEPERSVGLIAPEDPSTSSR